MIIKAHKGAENMQSNDWRIRHQEEYLKNKTFVFSKVKTDDHEHCEFCFEKFGSNYSTQAYTTLDSCFFVCEKCYNDFKKIFNFKLYNKANFQNKKLSEIIACEMAELEGKSEVYNIEEIKNLLFNILNVTLKKEKLIFLPCYGTLSIDKPIRVEELPERSVVIETSEVKQVLDRLSEFDLLSKNTDGYTKLCLSVRATGDTGDG